MEPQGPHSAFQLVGEKKESSSGAMQARFQGLTNYVALRGQPWTSPLLPQ